MILLQSLEPLLQLSQLQLGFLILDFCGYQQFHLHKAFPPTVGFSGKTEVLYPVFPIPRGAGGIDLFGLASEEHHFKLHSLDIAAGYSR